MYHNTSEMSTQTSDYRISQLELTDIRLPFPLPTIQGKKLKKKCCRKFERKGKRCKRCPGGR